MEASRSLGRKRQPSYSKSLSNTFDESGPLDAKKKVNQTLLKFRNLFRILLDEHKADHIDHSKSTNGALIEAAMLMQKKSQWVNSKKLIGHVPGIEVGDLFMYRAELNVVGLHRQFSTGIDFMGNGENSWATSIVVTNRYANARESSDSLIYIGEGGNPTVSNNSVLHDQKLEGGNLALKNSMDAKSPVRVILKVFSKSGNKKGYNFAYMYDGLYLVEKMIQERGEFGKLVFKFLLNRILEQPSTHVASNKGDVITNTNRSEHCDNLMFNKRLKSKGCTAKKDVIIMNDISGGQEKFPIRVVTSTNGDQMPTSFTYKVNVIHDHSFKPPPIYGCDCADECVDCQKCACNVKNGGNIPYDINKRLVSGLKSSLVYECGPSCKCSSSCNNRVSQNGIQFRLEIFMTELKGWGVRSRSFIPSGSFVCEYIGEICQSREARPRRNDGDSIAIMGTRKGFIDATRYGNIGRFINHSCYPNLHVKDVLYDHNDKNLPHKMLFAAWDIPPGKELSYDYNSCKASFVSSISSNHCHCRSPDCIGQIYL